jgi:mono/diheme cytochrome c family protein
VSARTALLGFVVVAAAALFGVSRALKSDPRERNLEVLPADMVVSPAAKSNGLVAAFADGLVQRAPPDGAIARGAMPLEYGDGEAEAKRAGEELVNPVPDTPAVLERGAFVFANYCSGCHGSGGLGDAPVTKRGFPPPPSLLRPESRALKDGEMFHAITFGRKNMPPAASQVERDDRWKAIRFVRSLQAAAAAENAAPKPADAPGGAPGDRPTDKPSGKPSDKPVDKPPAPVDKPGDGK